MTRRGLTLLEILWALALGVILSALVLRLLTTMSRFLRDARARADLQATVRSAVDYLGSELANVGWGDGRSDIIAATPGRIQLRARRALAVACHASAAGSLLLRAQVGYGRPPAPGRDSLAIFLEGDSSVTSDDDWLPLPVLGTSSSLCPDGDSAVSVSTRPDPRLAPGGGVVFDAPVVSWEIIEARSYMSGGETWLGEQSLTGGGVIEPTFGPLSSTGFDIRLAGVGGGPVIGPSGAAMVELSVRAIARSHGGMVVPLGTPLTDSLSATIALRNAGPGWGWP